MADTMFNIFETGIENRIRKTLGENAFAKKSKGSTPSKIDRNTLGSKLIDSKKKSFFHNEGASMQTFRDEKKMAHTPFKKPLQVYEDKTEFNRADEIAKIEFNYKTEIEDDPSDDEFSLSDKQMTDLVFGLPTDFIRTFDKHSMIHPGIEEESDVQFINDFTCDDYPESDNFQFDHSVLPAVM